VQPYHSKCALWVRLLMRLKIIKAMPRFRVTHEAPALGSINYKCDRCGSRLHIDTDWEDPDLVADFVIDTRAYPVEVCRRK
jgi:hypothetical protein